MTVVGACVTLLEAVRAADLLAAENISITIIDPFTVKPIDGKTISECAKKTNGKILTVEDHYAEGEFSLFVGGVWIKEEVPLALMHPL